MNQNTDKQVYNKPLFIICALLAVVGLVCWVMQLTKGLQMTNLNTYNTWGLYIIGFMIFTGIAAGSLLFSSSAFLFNSMAEYKPYAAIATIVGVICSVATAGLFIMVDMGNPLRAWRFIAGANVSSPMFWDFLIIILYLIIGIIFVSTLMKVAKGQKDSKSMYGISLAAFIAGLLVTITSFVFALQVARPLWNNPVQPISFLAAAIVAALALQIILFSALNKSGAMPMSSDKLAKLGKIAGIFLFVELLVVIGEAIVGMYSGSGEEAPIIYWLVAGEGAAYFWVEFIAIIAGLVLLFKKTDTSVTGAGVALFAIFMIKYNLLQAQLSNPLLIYPGSPAYSSNAYFPSLIEIGLFIGIISFGVVLALIAVQKISLGTKTNVGVNSNQSHGNIGVEAKA
jgi:molybdopterin-containing oxidoreductase family membrane subunit